MDLKRKHIAILAIFAAVVMILTAVIFLVTQLEAAYTMPVRVEVIAESKMAFDLNTSIATYGKMSAGGMQSRYFDVNNTGTSPVKVIVRVSGDVAPWIIIAPNTFIVTPEQKRGGFEGEMTIPRDAVPGNYSGKLHVYVLKQ